MNDWKRRIIEAVGDRLVVGGVQQERIKTFENLPIHSPERADAETVPVLLVPVWDGDVAAVKRRLEKALEHGSDLDAFTKALEDDEGRGR
jgi:hypothetical protein